jgi:type VI secretion system secreted protein Hcp
MRQTMMENEIAGNAGLPLLEEVMMTYQKIQWAWNDGGITAMDDWQAGIV